MHNLSLVIFANFRIDNKERYLRMQDSFLSFKDISAQKWVINIRGEYKKKAFSFLNKHLKGKLCFYELESDKGWFYDSNKMLAAVDSDFVFVWIEDHINMVDTSKYDEILYEMDKNNCDHLAYTWWHDISKKKFDPLTKKESKNLNFYKINEDNIRIVEDNMKRSFYIISLASILSSSLFKKILTSSHPFLKRWPKGLPFDFEKRSTDLEFVPFIHSVPKFELFASIDDDHGSPGYSLINRGLYPDRNTRENLRRLERKNINFSFVAKILPPKIYKISSILYNFVKRIMYTLS
jgi:hypothetical protein